MATRFLYLAYSHSRTAPVLWTKFTNANKRATMATMAMTTMSMTKSGGVHPHSTLCPKRPPRQRYHASHGTYTEKLSRVASERVRVPECDAAGCCILLCSCVRACALVWSVCLFVYVSLCSPEKRDLFKVEFYEKRERQSIRVGGSKSVPKMCGRNGLRRAFTNELPYNRRFQMNPIFDRNTQRICTKRST